MYFLLPTVCVYLLESLASTPSHAMQWGFLFYAYNFEFTDIHESGRECRFWNLPWPRTMVKTPERARNNMSVLIAIRTTKGGVASTLKVHPACLLWCL